MKSKGNTLIIEKKKILQRRSEFFRELFHDERLHKYIESLEILKVEVRSVLDKMNSNKNPGLNVIIIYMLTTLDDFLIDKTTEQNIRLQKHIGEPR